MNSLDANTYLIHSKYEQILTDMISEYKNLSGITPLKNSDIFIKLKILASQIFSLQSKLEWIKKQVFPQSATGKFLDYHAQTRGLTRKKASHSIGTLTFSISNPAENNIIIPLNTICFSSLNPSIKFSTTTESIIKKGETQATVEAQSISDGLETNINTGFITNMCNPPQYIESVINKTDFQGGCDEESDDDLRLRLLNSFKNISNGSNCAYYYNIAINHDGILSVNVIPKNRGRGTVDIIVHSNKKDKNLISTIQSKIDEEKEINVDALVLEAKEKKIDISVSLETDSTFSFDLIAEKVKKKIQQFMSNIAVYEPLKLVVLGAQIFSIPGIKNYKFSMPSNDVYTNKDEIISVNQINISKL